MTKTKFFATQKINKEEEIEALVNEFKAMQFENENDKEKAIEEMQSILNGFNADLKAVAVYPYTQSKNLLADLVPEIKLTDKENANINTRKNKVYNAISYKSFAIVFNEVEGVYVIKERINPVLVKDIVQSHLDTLANGHADQKPTKEDYIKARKMVLDTHTEAYLKLFIYGAYRF